MIISTQNLPLSCDFAYLITPLVRAVMADIVNKVYCSGKSEDPLETCSLSGQFQ